MNAEIATFLLFAALALMVYLSPGYTRYLGGTLLLSSLYYGLLGPFYWLEARGGFFLGVYWGDELFRASAYINFSAVLITLSTLIFASLYPVRTSLPFSTNLVSKDYIPRQDGLYLFLLLLGLFSSSFVGLQVVSGAAVSGNSPFLLIAYQFSDVMIPILVYSIGRWGFNRFTLLTLVAFTALASAVGFRYKLVLLYFPIISILLFSQRERIHNGRIKAAILFILLGALFSLLTIARQKFVGVDFSSLSSANSEDTVYGFLAETNSLFGLIGVIHESIDFGTTIGIQPLTDGFLELIPKALFPDRTTGEYLTIPLQRLLAEEALTSGTAYPIAGELLLMGGIGGLIAGSFFIGFLYVRLSHLALLVEDSRGPLCVGALALLGTFFGYYSFSRGYFPQTLKGVIFILGPIFFLLYRETRCRVPS